MRHARRRLKRALVFSAGMILTSCAQLPSIQPNTCGNGFTEGEEQCDLHEEMTLAKKGERLRCADPSDVLRACRYVCSRTDPASAQCPTGWGCSEDGICHAASGT